MDKIFVILAAIFLIPAALGYCFWSFLITGQIFISSKSASGGEKIAFFVFVANTILVFVILSGCAWACWRILMMFLTALSG